MKRYKFLRKGMKSEKGDAIWTIGKWKKFDGKLELCMKGFHCSRGIYQAFSFVHGEILAEVEVKGKSIKQTDKEVWSEMKIVKTWKWQKEDSVMLAVFAAEQAIDIFEKYDPEDKRPREAIEAAKKWVKNPTKKNMAASSVADAAAWAAGAAGAAAEAASSVASSVAGAARAAGAAAGAAGADAEAAGAARADAEAVGATFIEKIEKWMVKRIKDKEK